MNINPCPFCGNPGIPFRPDAEYYPNAWDIGCETDGCFMSEGCEYRIEKDEVIALWNQRPQPSAPVQPVATAYAIIYEDPDRQHEVFMGGDAAVSATKRFALISDRWNAHLFERVPFGDNTVEGFVAPASPSAPREPTEAEREALWAALRASGEIVHPGRLAPSAQPQPEEGVKELIADGFIAAILHGDEKHQQWLKDFNLSKHLKPAPEPSVAVEAPGDLWKLQRRLMDILPPEPMCRDCADRDGTCDNGKPCDPIERAFSYIASLQSAAHPGIVPGWVMVPVEPTEAMIEAGYSAAVSAGQMRYSTLKFIWERMLAAAPKGQP